MCFMFTDNSHFQIVQYICANIDFKSKIFLNDSKETLTLISSGLFSNLLKHVCFMTYCTCILYSRVSKNAHIM